MVSTVCLIQNDSPPPPRKKPWLCPLRLTPFLNLSPPLQQISKTLDWEREELQVYHAFLRGMLQ